MIYKCCKFTRDSLGDNYNCLFRKDEIFDDIIKYMFFIFGNKVMVKSYSKKFKKIYFILLFIVKPIKKYIDYEGNTPISIQNFLDFFELFLVRIKKFTPMIMRMILKLINTNVKEIFTIDEGNINPLYTCYIFNFFASPKILDLYDFNPSRYINIRLLNRVIRVNNFLFFYLFSTFY